MADHKRLRKQKIKMFNEDPNCRRCGVPMWLTPVGSTFRKGQLTQEQLDTMATIGHKYSRYDGRRWSESHENKQHRLICHKCNQIEQVEEASKVPIEELWRRSGRRPQELTLTSC